MIFNKNNTGAAEAKALLGFIYKSNNFENLLSYVKIAERHIKRVIDSEVYELADVHYNSENYKAESPTPQQKLLDELVEKIQLPLLIRAYRKYAPLNDISHSESGRQITVTDELKPAFSWQIEQSDRSLIDVEYETTDILLEFLDEQPEKINGPDEGGHGAPIIQVANTIFDTWFASKAYERTKEHFITSALQFDCIYPINESRRLYLVLIPFMGEIEKNIILPIITKEKYDIIIELLKDKDLDEEVNAEYKDIYEKSLAPIALHTIATALKRLNIELLPNSVVQNFTATDLKQQKIADSVNRIELAEKLRHEANLQLIPLREYIQSLLPATEQYVEEPFDKTRPFFMS